MACMSALWHFENDVRNLNLNFSKRSVSDVTKNVNGGKTGETERENYFNSAINILIIQPI